MMTKKLRMGMMSSMLAVASAFSVAGPASATELITCHSVHGNSNGGNYFSTNVVIEDALYLAEVTVWYGPAGGFGNVVNGMEWKHCKNLASGTFCRITSRGTQVGSGGPNSKFTLDWQNGERLKFIFGRSGLYVDGIMFSTNWKTSQWYGGTGGNDWGVEQPSGTTFFNDFYGFSGSIIDRLGFCTAVE